MNMHYMLKNNNVSKGAKLFRSKKEVMVGSEIDNSQIIVLNKYYAYGAKQS